MRCITMFTIHLNHACVAEAKQMQCAPGRAGMYRLPVAIKNENRGVENQFHGFFQHIPARLHRCFFISTESFDS